MRRSQKVFFHTLFKTDNQLKIERKVSHNNNYNIRINQYQEQHDFSYNETVSAQPKDAKCERIIYDKQGCSPLSILSERVHAKRPERCCSKNTRHRNLVRERPEGTGNRTKEYPSLLQPSSRMVCGSISSSTLILNFTPAGNEREERKLISCPFAFLPLPIFPSCLH
jgi:hypothetical protein